MTDMLELRLLLVGGYSGLVLFHLCHAKPLRIPLRWSALFVCVNATAAALLISDRYGAALSEEEEERFKLHFSKLTRGQYYQLIQMGHVKHYEDGEVLTVEGKFCPKLYFVLSGKGCKVYHHKAFVSNIDAGGFVNDVAFSQSHFDLHNNNSTPQRKEEEKIGAYGTVVTMGKCTVMEWDQQLLRQHLKSRPDMERNMKYCLSEHLVYTLLSQREAAHLRQQRWNTERREKENESNSSVKEEEEEDATLLTQEKTSNPSSSSSSDPKNANNNALTKKDRKVSIQRRKSILRRSPSNNSIEWVEVEDDDLTQKLNHAQRRISKSNNNTNGDDGIGSQNALFSNTRE